MKACDILDEVEQSEIGIEDQIEKIGMELTWRLGILIFLIEGMFFVLEWTL